MLEALDGDLLNGFDVSLLSDSEKRGVRRQIEMGCGKYIG